ncbi:unnamed protein product [Polarella glacialis]|uniref:Uncharacterized protein n=1 Tax=Polarella glacialis TaxID=89957 RepID=A0A813EPB0_POLGL|nr:unnamed protein product [Polarella glacialis]
MKDMMPMIGWMHGLLGKPCDALPFEAYRLRGVDRYQGDETEETFRYGGLLYKNLKARNVVTQTSDEDVENNFLTCGACTYREDASSPEAFTSFDTPSKSSSSQLYSPQDNRTGVSERTDQGPKTNSASSGGREASDSSSRVSEIS